MLSHRNAGAPGTEERVVISTRLATMNADRRPMPNCPMSCTAPALSLARSCSRSRRVPELPMVERNVWISSSVRPAPLSSMVSVFASASGRIRIAKSGSSFSPRSPARASRLRMESWAFWIISRRNTSGSAYRFCASMEINPSISNLMSCAAMGPPRLFRRILA